MNNLVHFVIPFENDERTFVVIVCREKFEKGTRNERGLCGSEVHVK